MPRADVVAETQRETARAKELMPKCNSPFKVVRAAAEPPPSQDTNFEVFCIYNRKGGVGKTTIAHNFAWTLAQRGNRVLLVDADPQCDVTTLLLRNHVKTTFEGDLDEIDRTGDLNLFYEWGNSENMRNNMFAALKPVIEAAGSNDAVIQAPDAMEIKYDDESIGHQHSGALLLVAGHQDLEEYELLVATALRSTLSLESNAPAAWYEILRLAAKKYNINVVVQDCNPSSGALSLNTVMCSDYIICPCFPDSLSLNAVSNLRHLLPKWADLMNECRDNEESVNPSAPYRLRRNTPIFLGTTMMRYHSTKSSDIGQTIPADKIAMWSKSILREVADRMVPALQANEATRGFIGSRPDQAPTLLLDMSDFNSLNALSHYHGVPVVLLGGKLLSLPGKTARAPAASVDKFSLQFFRFLYKIYKRQKGNVVRMEGVNLDEFKDVQLDPDEDAE